MNIFPGMRNAVNVVAFGEPIGGPLFGRALDPNRDPREPLINSSIRVAGDITLRPQDIMLNQTPQDDDTDLGYASNFGITLANALREPRPRMKTAMDWFARQGQGIGNWFARRNLGSAARQAYRGNPTGYERALKTLRRRQLMTPVRGQGFGFNPNQLSRFLPQMGAGAGDVPSLTSLWLTGGKQGQEKNAAMGDRTGPRGEGPMTGRGMGYCAGMIPPPLRAEVEDDEKPKKKPKKDQNKKKEYKKAFEILNLCSKLTKLARYSKDPEKQTDAESMEKAPETHKGEKLPERKRKQWRHVYEGSKVEGDSDERAARKAWGAVKKTAEDASSFLHSFLKLGMDERRSLLLTLREWDPLLHEEVVAQLKEAACSAHKKGKKGKMKKKSKKRAADTPGFWNSPEIRAMLSQAQISPTDQVEPTEGQGGDPKKLEEVRKKEMRKLTSPWSVLKKGLKGGLWGAGLGAAGMGVLGLIAEKLQRKRLERAGTKGLEPSIPYAEAMKGGAILGGGLGSLTGLSRGLSQRSGARKMQDVMETYPSYGMKTADCNLRDIPIKEAFDMLPEAMTPTVPKNAFKPSALQQQTGQIQEMVQGDPLPTTYAPAQDLKEGLRYTGNEDPGEEEESPDPTVERPKSKLNRSIQTRQLQSKLGAHEEGLVEGFVSRCRQRGMSDAQIEKLAEMVEERMPFAGAQ